MIICPHCNQANDNAALHCGSCGKSLIQREMKERQNPDLVTLTPDGQVTVEVHSLAEAKLALKELKMRKKQLNLQKKAVNEQMRQVRADYTARTRNRSMMMPGGGTLGRVVRTAQAASRQTDKQNLAAALAPLEHEKRWYESVILAVEQATLMLEADLMKYEG